MKWLRQTIPFLVFSNLFIAVCAAALTWETSVLLQLPADSRWYIGLTGSATLFIYAFHYFSKQRSGKTGERLSWCRSHPWVLPLSMGAGALISGWLILRNFKALFYQQSIFHFALLFLIPLLSFAYSHPVFFKKIRNIGWLKPLVLTCTWTAATTWAPVIIAGAGESYRGNDLSPGLLFLHRFIFIAPLVVLFNLYDLEKDRQEGIRTPAVRLGEKKILASGKWIFTALNLLGALLLLYYFNLYQWTAVTALLLPAGLIYYLFSSFSRHTKELMFILKNDGLILLKAALLIFAAG